MKTVISIATASALIALAAASTPAAAGSNKAGASTQKCYGIALAGKNDCKAGAGTTCAGSSTINYDGQRFKDVKAGSCLSLGGTLQPHAGHAAPRKA